MDAYSLELFDVISSSGRFSGLTTGLSLCSVGGYTVLSTAAANPDLVSGLVLLNASGQFESSSPNEKLGDETPEKEVVEMEESVLSRIFISPIKNTVQKFTIFFAFWQAKQPKRIESVLRNVSTKHSTNPCQVGPISESELISNAV